MALSDENLILNLPFDEGADSKTAYDYSNNRYDGEVVDASFIAGKQGNCIHFDGAGHCDVQADGFDLSGDFTLLAWVKINEFPDGWTGKRLGFNFVRDEVNGYQEVWLEDLEPGQWYYIAIVKEGLKVALYRDTVLLQELELEAQPVGLSVLQDIYSTDYAYADVDELRIYTQALTQDEITESLNTVSMLAYSIDGVDFKDYEVYVSDSSGLLDRPKSKTPLSQDWDNCHGTCIDLRNRRFQTREISLSCFLPASGKIDFVTKVNAFLEAFAGGGTHRLMVAIHPTKPLVYEVYSEDSIAISKRWSDNTMVGSFTLKLKEPDPVKRVVRHQRTGSGTAVLSMTLTATASPVNIYWGDGEVDYDVYGTAVEISHEYADNGIYYAIVGGVIEDITEFETNGIVVWSKI